MKKFDLKNLQGSKRTLRSGSYATVLAVVVLAFVILVNLVVQALPSKWTEFDISTSSLFTLSDTSKNLLHELNSDVTARCCTRPLPSSTTARPPAQSF